MVRKKMLLRNYVELYRTISKFARNIFFPHGGSVGLKKKERKKPFLKKKKANWVYAVFPN